MKKLTVAVCVVAALTLAGVLTGCNGSKDENPTGWEPEELQQIVMPRAQDARDFVQGRLDVLYKGTCSAAYKQLTVVTDEQMTAAHREALEQEAYRFCAFAGIQAGNLSPESFDKVKDMVNLLYKSAKYEVGPATPTEDGFALTVTVSPLDIMGLVGTLDMLEIDEQYYSDVPNLGAPEAEALRCQRTVDEVLSHVAAMGFMDPVTLGFSVLVAENGELYLDDAQCQAVGENLICYYFPNAG